MFEYDRIWDASDELNEINELAQEGWRVIAAFPDSGRGTMFIIERRAYSAEELATMHVDNVKPLERRASPIKPFDAHDKMPA